MNECKHKHLEFTQGVINRLSTNSFLLKGWTVILISALVALSSKSSHTLFIYIPIIIFWGLDGFFLWREQCYRGLYDYVRNKDSQSIDFSMNPDEVEYPEINKPKPSWCKATFSKTLIPFYGALLGLVTVFFIYDLFSFCSR